MWTQNVATKHSVRPHLETRVDERTINHHYPLLFDCIFWFLGVWPYTCQVTKKKQRVKPKPAGGFGSAWPQAREPTANATLKYKPRMWADLILAS